MTAPPYTYSTIPQPIVAQQFVDENTALTICAVYSISINYDLTGGGKTVVANVGTPTKTYLMSGTDWIVLGPNIEGVYTDSAFKALFQAASSTLVPYVSPVNGDSMSAQLELWSDSGKTAAVDWGDGTSTTGITVAAGTTPTVVTHTYASAARYSVVVTGGPVPITCYFAAVQATVSFASDQGAAFGNAGSEVIPPSQQGPVVPSMMVAEAIDDPSNFDPLDLETAGREMFSLEANDVPIDPNNFGEWTPEQMARIEAGLNPYE
jgi:hypothetical protein